MSADPEIYFDCPNCKIMLSVSKQQAGNQILCPKCGEHVDSPDDTNDTDWMLDGLTDQEKQGDIPGSLKIDGISNDQDELAWDIVCNVCDSTLLVNQQQVGTKVRCNDCHSLHEVQPPKEQQAADATTKATNSKSRREPAIDDDFMQLAPAIELPSEYKAAQTETLLGDIPDLDIEPQAAAAATVEPVTSFSSGAESDDDSDEMIELSDLPPEALNQSHGTAAPPNAESETETDAPVRVFAKRRPKKKKEAEVKAPSESIASDAFEDMSLGGVIDRAVRLLQSSAILIWAAGAILLLSFGGAFWHWIGPDRLDPETATIVSRIVQSGIAFLFGQGVFLIGYVALMFVAGVIFRETAQGQTKVESVSSANMADFQSTMLLFGFSMFIAALPWLLTGAMFVTIPLQFFGAGIFLFCAWKNQSPFMIISESLFDSFSLHFGDWKRWAKTALIAAAVGMIGGALMEVSLPALSIFTSIAGAILITIATLFYAAATGWHCGNLVQQMKDPD